MGRDDADELDDELDEADAEDEDEDEEEDEVDEEDTASEARRVGGFVAGVALGALLGAAAALLFAPAPGHVTRRRLRRKLDHARELAGEQWEELSRRAKREIKRRVDAVERG